MVQTISFKQKAWRMLESTLLVIPVLNEKIHIVRVLDEISHDLPENVHIVVADGGSTDDTVEIVKRYIQGKSHISLLHNHRRIQSSAVNLAVQEFGVGFEYLIRCDAHASYPERFVSDLIASIQARPTDSVVVPMDSLGETCFQKGVGWVSDSRLGSGGSAHRGGMESGFVDHGHHAIIRIESFRQIGGYNESFTHNEDAEFDCRFRAFGNRIYLDSSIRVTYHPRATISGLFRQYFNYGRGRSRTVRRHPSSLRLRQFAVPSFIGMCAAFTILSPAFPVLIAIPLLYLLALSLNAAIIAARNRSLCGMWAAPASFSMHVGWALGFFAGLLTTYETPWKKEHDLQPLFFEIPGQERAGNEHRA